MVSRAALSSMSRVSPGTSASMRLMASVNWGSGVEPLAPVTGGVEYHAKSANLSAIRISELSASMDFSTSSGSGEPMAQRYFPCTPVGPMPARWASARNFQLDSPAVEPSMHVVSDAEYPHALSADLLGWAMAFEAPPTVETCAPINIVRPPFDYVPNRLRWCPTVYCDDDNSTVDHGNSIVPADAIRLTPGWRRSNFIGAPRIRPTAPVSHATNMLDATKMEL